MKFLLMLTIVLTAAVAMISAQGTPSPAVATPAGATYVDSAKVTAAVAKPTGGAIFAREQNARVGVMRLGLVHQGSAEPEVHEKTTHIWVMIDGEATIVTGGTLVDSRSTGTGQFKGSNIQGGQTYQLKKGDVITIPAGTPHWIKEVPTETIAFYVVDLG